MKKSIFIWVSFVFLGIFACGSTQDTEIVKPENEITDDGKDGEEGNLPEDNPLTWYVSVDGNDSYAGTIDRPFRTINRALAGVNPGDTVLIRSGDYHELVVWTRSGESGKRITLKNYPGETARIDGSGLEIIGWHSPLLLLKSVRYATIEGLHICNAVNAAAKTDPEGIYIEGSSRSITVRNCRIYNIKNSTLQTNEADWRSAHAILVVGTDDKSPIRDLVIEGCEIHDICTGTSETLTIAGNVDGFTVQNNKVYDVENIGIIIAGGDNLNPSGDIGVNYARNGVVRNNLVYNCTHRNTIEFWGPTRYGAIGIYVCGSSGVTVERNIVYGCDRGIGLVSESNALATRDCIVRNNFVYSNHRTGIYMGDYLNFVGLGTHDCFILNNTLFNNNLVAGDLPGIDDGDGSEGEIRLTENCYNNVIKNNIVYATQARDIFVRKYTKTGNNNVIDYNHYYTTAPEPKWYWEGVEYKKFEDWKQACQGDENSVYGVDPLLKNVSILVPDLHLQLASPARNNGLVISAYMNGGTDIDGEPRIINEKINKGADQ